MRIGRRTGIGLIVLALTAILTAGVVAVAGTRPSDRGLPPARHGGGGSVDHKVDSLLRQMTTKEKLEQLQLLSDGQITDEAAREGVGGVFSLTDPEKINHFQHVAVEESRLHIPIL